MLEISPICENCGVKLPNDSVDAMICSFECTFCRDCVESVLYNVCPNCGGGFENRPIRPLAQLEKYPASEVGLLKAIDSEKFRELLSRYGNISPRLR